MNKTIFISHQNKDKQLAEIIKRFLVDCGVRNEEIFCSSIPGNDVEQNFKDEVRVALDQSIVDIVVLSNNYYNSVFCLNEAGVCWYKKIRQNHKIICFATYDINMGNMNGFLDNSNILRRFDNGDDWYSLVKNISSVININNEYGTISRAIDFAIDSYNKMSDFQVSSVKEKKKNNNIDVQHLTLNEKVIIYYCLLNETIKINYSKVTGWLRDNELFGFDIDMGFTLLEKSNYCKKVDDEFDFLSNYFLDIDLFRKLSFNNEIKEELRKIIFAKQDLSSKRFQKIIADNPSDNLFIFLSYIYETKTYDFGDRSLLDYSLNHYNSWLNNINISQERKGIDYRSMLSFLIDNRFVYVSKITTYNNPKNYTLYQSIKDFISNPNDELINKMNDVMTKYMDY